MLCAHHGHCGNLGKSTEGYREENISKLNPKIIVTVDGETVVFVLSVNDSSAKISEECYEWALLPISLISKVVDLDNQESNCETLPVNLKGQSASISLVDKVSMLMKPNVDSFYVKKVTSERTPVVLLEGIQYESHQPYSFVSVSSEELKLKIEFRAKADCLRYEYNEKTDECKGKYLPIQWGGFVQKEIKLKIAENKIDLK
jgi:hypothetical protein